ncbi:C-type lectin-like [Uranotaenia lowii]|uniref:C-type lectin-like n=1 Tax=Uranotaenia lowii TaxID=190385 RepID=UPI0024793B01|nr:C-type lectin-like [Uranotaenia lowii]
MFINSVLVLTLAITAIGCSGSSMKDGESPNRYVVHRDQQVTFFDAWKLCHRDGHRLATVNSFGDSAQLEEAIKAAERREKTTGVYWIGATNVYITDQEYMWLSTNEPVKFTHYAPGQPDNAWWNENCLNVGQFGGVLWNDVSCASTLAYVCEEYEKVEC